MARCKLCKKKCEPFNSLMPFCNHEHAIEYLNTKKGKEGIKKVERKQHKERKKQVKGLNHWKKETQKVINKYVRIRDRDLPCISCGKWDHELKEAIGKGKWDAGHYKTVGSRPELRFDTRNINKQCLNCNQFKSGNIEGYKEAIIERYGKDRLDWLNGPHKSKDYSIEDLERMRKVFNRKIRLIERRGEL